jgi:hypothetical protein
MLVCRAAALSVASSVAVVTLLGRGALLLGRAEAAFDDASDASYDRVGVGPVECADDGRPDRLIPGEPTPGQFQGVA